MLALPSTGFRRSVSVHNVDIAICCDWMEASALFTGEPVVSSEIVDLLQEEQVYDSQEFAWAFVADLWSHLQRRVRLMGDGYPFTLSGSRFGGRGSWSRFTPYSFCLTLSLTKCYPSWAKSFGKDYTDQGELFEALTAESIGKSLLGWNVHATGWTRENPTQLARIVEKIAELLGENAGDLKRWTSPGAHEEGLDLLCYRPFRDGRVGVPTYLFQCASGEDWEGKLHTPDLRVWNKAIVFAAEPKKAFSLPFVLSDNEFRQSCNRVNGLLLDRHRLLAPGQRKRDWVTADLSKRLAKWMLPRIKKLQKLYQLA